MFHRFRERCFVLSLMPGMCLQWMYGPDVGDMSFDDLFEDEEDEDMVWTGANQW